jgi:hypothetical protein
MKWRFEFMTLTQLGEVFGTTSHQVGRWLVEIGLRTSAKKPSKAAFDGGYVKAGPSRNQGYNWIWHSERTVQALETAGHKLAIQPGCELLNQCRLSGPFAIQAHPQFGHQVINGDGSVAVWISGEQNAQFVCSLLNLADRNGVVERMLGTGTSGGEGKTSGEQSDVVQQEASEEASPSSPDLRVCA